MPEKTYSNQDMRERLRNRTQQAANDAKGGGSQILNMEGMGKVRFFEAHKGLMKIDHIPFIARTNLFAHKNTREGDPDFMLDVWVHRSVGPGKKQVLCLRRTFDKSCPICEEAFRMKDAGMDKDTVKPLWPTQQTYFNIIDAEHEEHGIQIFRASHYLYTAPLLRKAEAGEEVVTFSALEDGRTVECLGVEANMGTSKYIEFEGFEFKRRSDFDPIILEEVYPLDQMLIVPTYEEVRDLYFGPDVEGNEDMPEPERPVSRYRKEPAAAPQPQEKPASRFRRGDAPAPEHKPKEVHKAPVAVAEAAPVPTERKHVTRTAAKTDNPCPSGYRYGVDTDQYKECKECDKWEKCVEASEDHT